MRQQINLYRGNLIDRPEPLQSRQAGLILVIAFVLALIFSGFSYWQLRGSHEQLIAIEQKQAEISVRVDELERQYPEPQQNALLKEEIRRLELQIQGQRQALSYFDGKDNNSNRNILSSLEGLARNPSKGLWLQSVRLLQEGDQVELDGCALEAKQIPDYLQMIGDRKIFGGKVFAQLKVKRMHEQDNRIDFTLGSTREKN